LKAARFGTYISESFRFLTLNLLTRFSHISPFLNAFRLRLFRQVCRQTQRLKLALVFDTGRALPFIRDLYYREFRYVNDSLNNPPQSHVSLRPKLLLDSRSQSMQRQKRKKHSRDSESPCQAVCLLPFAHLHRTHEVLAVGNIAIRSFAAVILGNAVTSNPRRDSTNMHRNVVILLMTIFLSSHIVKGDRQCCRNLRRTSTLFDSAAVRPFPYWPCLAFG
jgi:hypothetical protein